MAKATETTALAVREEQSGEMAVSQQTALARAEIESSIIIAHRFPRNEDEARRKLMQVCDNFAFANDGATYKYNRGKLIKGPGVKLAREAARCWGNIRYGQDIVMDEDEKRTVRGWAWDLQTNNKSFLDATFRKLQQRKVGKSGNATTEWVVPDERDLREITNTYGSKCYRNCILNMLPRPLVMEAERRCEQAVEAGMSEGNPEDQRHKMAEAFGALGVNVMDLEQYLEHSLKQVSAKELADLKLVYRSVRDGVATWAGYVADKQQDEPGATVADILKPAPKEPEQDTACQVKTDEPLPSDPVVKMEEYEVQYPKVKTVPELDRLNGERIHYLESLKGNQQTRTERCDLLSSEAFDRIIAAETDVK